MIHAHPVLFGLGTMRSRAVAWWQANAYDSGADALLQLAAGGVSAARFGSSVGSDSGDPKLLSGGGAVYLPGTASNYISTPDSAANSVTGSIDLRGRFMTENPLLAQNLIDKFVTASDMRSFRLNITVAGAIYVGISNNGAAEQVQSALNPPTALAANVPFWIRATYNVSTGLVQVFMRPGDTDVMPADWGTPATSTASAVGAIYDSTAPLSIGATNGGGNVPFLGKCFYAEVRNGIDGPVVAKFDAGLTGQEGYTDPLNSTVWTVYRSTTGRKSVVLDGRAGLSFATDDYLDVGDHPALNFGAGEEFSACALVRRFSAPGSSQVVLAKKTNLTTAAGWSLHMDTSAQIVARVGDGVANVSANTSAMVGGRLSFVAMVRRGGLLYAHLNGVTSAGAADTTGSAVNSDSFRAGRLMGPGTNYADMELFAFAVFRAGLNDNELARVRAEMERT